MTSKKLNLRVADTVDQFHSFLGSAVSGILGWRLEHLIQHIVKHSRFQKLDDNIRKMSLTLIYGAVFHNGPTQRYRLFVKDNDQFPAGGTWHDDHDVFGDLGCSNPLVLAMGTEYCVHDKTFRVAR